MAAPAFYSVCRKCGWRMGGPVDSWDGKGCKCGKSVAPLHECKTCLGYGRIRDGGTGRINDGGTGAMRPCLNCGGSGLVP